MDYFERIQKSIDFIESRLKERFSLKDVASEAAFSLYHFQRVFHSLAGHNLKEYIRKRRLSDAAHALNCTQKTVTELAFEYQYSNVESFSRAFRRQYGMNPTDYRRSRSRNANQLVLFEKLNIIRAVDNQLAGFENVKPEIVSKPSFPVIGIRKTMHFNDRNFMNDFLDFRDDYLFHKKWNPIPGKTESETVLAIGSDLDTVNATYVQTFGAAVAGLEDIPEGYSGMTVKSSKYACFRVFGLRPVIQKAWNTIFDQWIFASPYSQDLAGTTIESFNRDWQKLEPGWASIYIPIIDEKSNS